MPARAVAALLLSAGPAFAAPTWHCLYAPAGSKPVFPMVLQQRGAKLVPQGGEFRSAASDYAILESNPGALVAVHVEKMYDPADPARINDPGFRAHHVPIGAAIAVIRIDKKSGLFQMTIVNSKSPGGETDQGHCTASALERQVSSAATWMARLRPTMPKGTAMAASRKFPMRSLI